MQRVCVFCGSGLGARSVYEIATRRLGVALAARGLGLVYGGASVGLMGVLADAVLDAGGQVTGVIPTLLVNREIAHRGLQDLRVVATMHERKALMADLADVFVVLPGGMGTLDETCEILTWAQLGLHAKPCGLLDVEGYFQPLITFLDHSVTEGFLRPEHRGFLTVDEDPDQLLDRLGRAEALHHRSLGSAQEVV